MKKVILFTLIIVLLGALIMPAISAPQPAEAAGTTVTCSPADLHFRVYTGVPTYLWGFIPLDGGQTLTLTLAGSGISGWTVTDNAGWLNENLLFGVLSSISSATRTQDITVRVNTDGLTAGTYTATIIFKLTTCGTKTITVPVTIDVIDPMVLGPLGIGMLNIFDTSHENYGGLTTELLTNPDNVVDMQAIETDGTWNLAVQRGDTNADGSVNILSGTLNINGVDKQITWGTIVNLGVLVSMMGGSLPLPADFDWGKNCVFMFSADDYTLYIGIEIADINALLPLVSSLGSMFSSGGQTTDEADINAPPSDDGTGATTSGPASNAPSQDMVIPLKPILNLLPSLMPVLSDLLTNETILAIIKPLLNILPPIMIVMPMSVMTQLVSGLIPS